MGLFDNAMEFVNRGTAAAERTTRTARLKLQINELMNKRKELAAQLGASLYEAVKDDPDFREGRESILDAIADIDRQRQEAEDEIQAIEQAAAQAQTAAASYSCPKCGTKVSGGHSFCPGCGMPVAEIIESYQETEPEAMAEVAIEAEGIQAGIQCPACGAPMEEGDRFCMNCGAKRGELPQAEEDVSGTV